MEDREDHDVLQELDSLDDLAPGLARDVEQEAGLRETHQVGIRDEAHFLDKPRFVEPEDPVPDRAFAHPELPCDCGRGGPGPGVDWCQALVLEQGPQDALVKGIHSLLPP